MIDDVDTFTTIEELKADMELASMRGFIIDILMDRVWFKGISTEVDRAGRFGKHIFVKLQIQRYADGLDKALNMLVWNAR